MEDLLLDFVVGRAGPYQQALRGSFAFPQGYSQLRRGAHADDVLPGSAGGRGHTCEGMRHAVCVLLAVQRQGTG